ncbi:MAG: hypothetical protein NZP34_08790 [Caldilineales bacterium]|nr:hypothetical protein [Caldilineales bacterium]
MADLAGSPSTDTARSYEAVGRQAWIILWAAFAVFLVIVIGTPLLIRWYVQNATVPRFARVEVIRGTALVTTLDSEAITAVVDTLPITRDGILLRTDDTARANISVYDDEKATVNLVTAQLRNNGELRFLRARTPRFRRSTLPELVEFQLGIGRVRVTGNSRVDRPVQIVVRTPHAHVSLRDGDDVAIAVTNENTEVSVRNGAARVEAQGQSVFLSGGQRTAVPLGRPPSVPMAGPVNLVVNGDFTAPLEGTWKVEALVDARDPTAVTYGTVTVVETGERKAAYFERDGEDGIHTETAIVQEINADVLDYDSLILRLDVRLISQSLPGGGQQSSEFPLMARIDFIDVDGNPQFWTWGFYAVDPIANWPIRDGEKIPAFLWYDYESPDFLNSPTFPRPQKVTRIRIYASGHNYRSMVTGIGLIAQ